MVMTSTSSVTRSSRCLLQLRPNASTTVSQARLTLKFSVDEGRHVGHRVGGTGLVAAILHNIVASDDLCHSVQILGVQGDAQVGLRILDLAQILGTAATLCAVVNSCMQRMRWSSQLAKWRHGETELMFYADARRHGFTTKQYRIA